METRSKLQERLNNVHLQYQDVLQRSIKDSRAINADEEAQLDKMDAEMRSIEKSIEVLERAKKMQSELQEAAPAESRKQESDEETHKRAMVEYIKSPKADAISSESRSILEKRTQVVGTQSAGGYAVIDTWDQAIVKVMKDFGGSFALGNVFDTETGGSYYILKADHTDLEGEWLTEIAAKTDEDVSWSRLTMGAYDLSSKGVRISLNLLQDNSFNIQSEILDVAAARTQLSLEKRLLTGTGSSQLEGWLVGAGSAAVTTASATAVTYDEIVDLVHSLRTAYRRNAKFAFNDTVIKALRKLKDSNGLPLWQPSSLSTGVPASILGYQYEIVHEMANYGTTANKFMAFGDFAKGFRIRRVKNPVLLREDHPSTREVSFYLHSRWDSKVVDAQAIKYAQHA